MNTRNIKFLLSQKKNQTKKFFLSSSVLNNLVMITYIKQYLFARQSVCIRNPEFHHHMRICICDFKKWIFIDWNAHAGEKNFF